jgi:hypothetical protein
MGRTRLVAIAALVAALAAGCGGAPTAKFVPPSSSSVPSDPTTTSAADVTPPVMPDLAKQHTVAGAKAFVKYYWAVANYAQTRLDPSPLEALADKQCAGCQGASAFVREVSRLHGCVIGGATMPSRFRVTPTRGADGLTWMDVEYAVSADPQQIDYPGNRHDLHYPGGHRSALMALRPTSAGWVVNQSELSA